MPPEGPVQTADVGVAHGPGPRDVQGMAALGGRPAVAARDAEPVEGADHDRGRRVRGQPAPHAGRHPGQGGPVDGRVDEDAQGPGAPGAAPDVRVPVEGPVGGQGRDDGRVPRRDGPGVGRAPHGPGCRGRETVRVGAVGPVPEAEGPQEVDESLADQGEDPEGLGPGEGAHAVTGHVDVVVVAVRVADEGPALPVQRRRHPRRVPPEGRPGRPAATRPPPAPVVRVVSVVPLRHRGPLAEDSEVADLLRPRPSPEVLGSGTLSLPVDEDSGMSSSF